MAAGRPVIAFGEGGALETVVPPGEGEPPTGLFFAHQTAEDLVDAIRRFEASALADPRPCATRRGPPPALSRADDAYLRPGREG
jgi:hypothetical protein